MRMSFLIFRGRGVGLRRGCGGVDGWDEVDDVPGGTLRTENGFGSERKRKCSSGCSILFLLLLRERQNCSARPIYVAPYFRESAKSLPLIILTLIE